jgi:hypothetical protein
MSSLSYKIQRLCKDKITSYDNVLAKDRSNDKAFYERAQAKFFLAMATAWEAGSDDAFHDEITADLHTALTIAPVDRKAEYQRGWAFVNSHCGQFDAFLPKAQE